MDRLTTRASVVIRHAAPACTGGRAAPTLEITMPGVAIRRDDGAESSVARGYVRQKDRRS